MKKCIYLTDLDDTLFKSLRKQNGETGLTRVTTATNGHHSHMSLIQKQMFELLRMTGAVIPVTARSSDAFARVHLDFGTGRAVLANGAVILDELGEPDLDWLSHTGHIGRAVEPLLREMSKLVDTQFGSASRSWIVEEHGAPVYFCVKMNAADENEIAMGIKAAAELLMTRLDLSGMKSHMNGNNLSFTPHGISKRDACCHLIDRIGDRKEALLIGIGDSLTDIPFMDLCDFMMLPCGSQIAERLKISNDKGTLH